MNIHLHRKPEVTELATDTGHCGTHSIVATFNGKTVHSHYCMRKLGNVPPHILIRLGYDPDFKGREPGQEDQPLPAPCLICITKLCAELHKWNEGLKSDVYE